MLTKKCQVGEANAALPSLDHESNFFQLYCLIKAKYCSRSEIHRCFGNRLSKMISACPAKDSTLHLPRILCLHGGGTNARIFKAQCRKLIVQLKSEYRLVFADGPFASRAGSDVLSVYSQWGPFRRWLRWQQDDPIIQHEDIVMAINKCLKEAVDQDDTAGGTGEWLAIMGFSQGAKVAASLLYRQQLETESQLDHKIRSNFRFGIFLAGRAPLVSMDVVYVTETEIPLPKASQITDFPLEHENVFRGKGAVLHLATLHVHGLRDDGIALHRQLLDEFCDPRSARLIEWDGDHRVPLKFKDVRLVVDQIRELGRLTQ